MRTCLAPFVPISLNSLISDNLCVTASEAVPAPHPTRPPPAAPACPALFVRWRPSDLPLWPHGPWRHLRESWKAGTSQSSYLTPNPPGTSRLPSRFSMPSSVCTPRIQTFGAFGAPCATPQLTFPASPPTTLSHALCSKPAPQSSANIPDASLCPQLVLPSPRARSVLTD